MKRGLILILVWTAGCASGPGTVTLQRGQQAEVQCDWGQIAVFLNTGDGCSFSLYGAEDKHPYVKTIFRNIGPICRTTFIIPGEPDRLMHVDHTGSNVWVRYESQSGGVGQSLLDNDGDGMPDVRYTWNGSVGMTEAIAYTFMTSSVAAYPSNNEPAPRPEQ